MFGLSPNHNSWLNEDSPLWPEESFADQSENGLFSDSNSSLHLDSFSTSNPLDDSKPSTENKVSIITNDYFSTLESLEAHHQLDLMSIETPAASSTPLPPSSITDVFQQNSFPIQQPAEKLNPQFMNSWNLSSSNQLDSTSTNDFSSSTTFQGPENRTTYSSSQSHLPYSSEASGQEIHFEEQRDAIFQQGKKRRREGSDSQLGRNVQNGQIEPKTKKTKTSISLSPTATHPTSQSEFEFNQELLETEKNQLIQEIVFLVEELKINQAQAKQEKLNIEWLKTLSLKELETTYKKTKDRIRIIKLRTKKKMMMTNLESSIDSEHMKIRKLESKISELIGFSKTFIFMYGDIPAILPIKQQIDTFSAELSLKSIVITQPKPLETEEKIEIEGETKQEKRKRYYQKSERKKKEIDKNKKEYLKTLQAATLNLQNRQQTIEKIIQILSQKIIITKFQ